MMSVEEIFTQAVALPKEKREPYLERVCGADVELRRQLEQLLSAHQQKDSLLDRSRSVTRMEPDSALKELGDFQILRELGRGGMGVVYEAQQKSLKRRVALKILSSGLGLSSKAILRFRREAEAAGKLHHTNIVPIYTTGEDGGVHYYAMEMVDGPSMDVVIRELRHEREGDRSNERSEIPAWVHETALFGELSQGNECQSDSAEVRGVTTDDQPPENVGSITLPTGSTSSISSGARYFDTVASMIADVADALDHAHEQGVIHRDMKPSNLLLSPDGRLSVNDFGLARMLEQPGMTISGEFVGSPLYMSPEQITAGRAPLDHRTDIYSLGATLYELLTLQPPFPAKSRDEAIAQILHKEPVSPRRINRRVPSDLETICLKAIERDPDRRYQTAGQLAADLRNFVHRHAISAKRLGPLGRVVKWSRRHPSAAGLIAVSCFTVLLMIAFAVYSKQQSDAKRQAELAGSKDLVLVYAMSGDFDAANNELKRAVGLGASNGWVEMLKGQVAMFQGDFDVAREHLTLAADMMDNSIEATALLAFAEMEAGDELAYFRLLEGLYEESPQTTDELLFMGLASSWGDPRKARELLTEAANRGTGRPLVFLVRAVANRFLAGDEVDPLQSRQYALEAIRDAEVAKGLVPNNVFLRGKQVEAKVIAALRSKELGENEAYHRYIEEIESSVNELRQFPLNPNAIATIYYAKQRLSGGYRNAAEYLMSADEEGLNNYLLGYRMIASFLTADVEQAKLDFAAMSVGNDFVGFVAMVELSASPDKEHRQRLIETMNEHVDSKILGDEFYMLGWVGLVLKLLEDEAGSKRVYEFEAILLNQQRNPLLKDIAFSLEYYLDGDRKKLLRDSAHSRRAMSSAYWAMGTEALAAGKRREAKSYFQQCFDEGEISFYTVNYSAAMLAKLEDDPQWPNWIPNNDTTETTVP